MSQFKVPSKAEVNDQNQAIFAQLESGLGFVPNVYAFLANHDNALGAYLEASNRKLSISKREAEVVNLVASEYNGCSYCLSAHTTIAGLNGFTAEQILEIRDVSITFDTKLAALAEFTKELVRNKGKVMETIKAQFFEAGYTVRELIDVVFTVGHITISNYIHGIAQFEIDFPLAPTIEKQLRA